MSAAYPTLRGDEGRLFTVHSAKLRSIVGREVRTSQANLDDACSFAWLQMLRYQPERERLLAWLCRTAIREAIKLDRRAQRSCELVDAGEADIRHADTGNPVDDRLELLAAGEAVVAARLRAREAELLSLQVAGFSYTETARLQRTTTRTVERQLRRARGKLRSARRAQAN
jgi:RNA polymerase sigma factor (sigma-70 family)